MKKTAKLLALLFSVVFTLTMLVSCAPAAVSTSAPAASTEAAQSAEPSASATASAAEPAPAASTATVELTYLVPTRVFIKDMATNDFTVWMEKQTGVHVTWQSIPQQGAEEKLSVIMASDDLPDVFMSCPITNVMLSNYGVDQKLFMPLDDLISKDCPNMMEAAGKSAGGLDVLRQIDGKLYSLPTFDTCQHCEQASKMWLYDPFLQKLGGKAPTTTEEFYQYLKKAQATDLNGNGKADEIPLAGCINGWHDRVEEFLLNSFCYYDHDANGFYVQDGKVTSCLDTPEYRDGLRYMKKLNDEKLIFDGSLTQDDPTLVKVVEGSADPQVVAVPGGWVGMFANFGGDRAKGYHPIAPLTGPAGYVGTPDYPSYPAQGSFVLSSKCKNPDAALKYADILYTKDATLWIRAGGAKDDYWRDAKPGEKDFYGNQAVWAPIKAWNDTAPQTGSWISLGVWNYTDLRASQTVKDGMDYWGKEGLEYMLFKETTDKYLPVVKKNNLPPRTYTVDEQDEVATLETQFKKFFESSQYNFITGQSSLDSDWDKYVTDLKSSGLTRLEQLYQTAYDRQYKKN